VFRALGWGITHVIIGALFDRYSYTPVMVLSTMITSALFVTGIIMDQDKYSTTRNAELPKYSNNFACSLLKPFNLIFLLTLFSISMGSALVEGLVFMYFRNGLHLSNFLMGITVMITVSFEIPLFFIGPVLSRTMGFTYMMIVGLLSYSIRVFVYTLATPDDIMILLLVEPLHGVTYTLIQMSSVYFMSELAPPEYSNSGQTVLSAIKAFGGGIGLLVGSFMFESFGTEFTYRAFGTFIGIMTCLFCLSRKCFVQQNTVYLELTEI